MTMAWRGSLLAMLGVPRLLAVVVTAALAACGVPGTPKPFPSTGDGPFVQPATLAGEPERDVVVLGTTRHAAAMQLGTVQGGRLPVEARPVAEPSAVPVAAPALVATGGPAPLPAGRFHVLASLDPAHYHDEVVQADAVATGAHCRLYVDRTLAGDDALRSRVEALVPAFDTRIYPTDTGLYGAPPRLAGAADDGRIEILVSPAVGDHGRTEVAGYFAWRDLVPAGTGGSALLRDANHRRLICLADGPLLAGLPADGLGTLAHEFAHMLVFARKGWDDAHGRPTGRHEEPWLDEAYAMFAMGACGYGADHGARFLAEHVARWAARPGAYSLTDWAGNPDHEAYGMAALFMGYLGADVVRAAAHGPWTGVPALEQALARQGTSLEVAFQAWTLAALSDGGVASPAPARAMTYTLRPYTAQYLALPGAGARALDARGVTPAAWVRLGVAGADGG